MGRAASKRVPVTELDRGTEPSALSSSTLSQEVSGAAVLQGKPMTAEELQQFLYRTKPKNGR